MNQFSFAFGQVRHTRCAPIVHKFAYQAFFMRIPIHSLKSNIATGQPSTRLFAVDRSNAPLSFHQKDHGDGSTPLLQWITELLHSVNIQADGEIWLHTFPRMFGYSFRPVSFWFCHGRSGKLLAILAEVNNTFSERHCYLLTESAEQTLVWGNTLTAKKTFHVSPFCSIAGEYQFRFFNTNDRCVARIDLHQAQDDTNELQPLIQTSLSGSFVPLSRQSAVRALTRYPLFTLMVVARIHFHAISLWWRKVPFFKKPTAPTDFVTRSISPNKSLET
jgi:uncharacterized protein